MTRAAQREAHWGHAHWGETNPRATLTDDEVDAIRDLYEKDRFKSRAERYWTPRRLAEKYEISVRYVKRIVQYQVRLAPMGEHD